MYSSLGENKLSGLLPALLPFHFPNIDKVRCCFSTRLYGNISLDAVADSGLDGGVPDGTDGTCETGGHDGYARTARRREEFAGLLGFERWTEMRQMHGDVLLINPEATAFDAPSALEADGCATDRPGQAMLSKSADCQQILLAHHSGRYVAALHAGWRGNAIGFPVSGVRRFCEAYGLKAEDVSAVRGPSLGPGAAEFVNFKNEWPAGFEPWFDEKTRRMDLWSLARHQLTLAGIRPENIYGLDFCTFTQRDIFFSHRGGHGGRQAAVIFIEK